MVKHTQTIRWLLPTNRLSVFDHSVGLALKGLRERERERVNVFNIFREISVIVSIQNLIEEF